MATSKERGMELFVVGDSVLGLGESGKDQVMCENYSQSMFDKKIHWKKEKNLYYAAKLKHYTYEPYLSQYFTSMQVKVRSAHGIGDMRAELAAYRAKIRNIG